MPLFRPQRGSLSKAMAEVVEVNDVEALRRHLGLSDSDALEIEDYKCFDDRIGWQTYLVLVNSRPIGYTNGML